MAIWFKLIYGCFVTLREIVFSADFDGNVTFFKMFLGQLTVIITHNAYFFILGGIQTVWIKIELETSF